MLTVDGGVWSPGCVLTPAGFTVVTGEEALAAQTAVGTREVLTAPVGTQIGRAHV